MNKINNDDDDDDTLLDNSKNNINRSKQMLSEMLETGSQISDEINDQRNKIEQNKLKLERTNDNIKESRHVLRKIEHNTLKSKLFLYGVIIVVVIVVIVVIVAVF